MSGLCAVAGSMLVLTAAGGTGTAAGPLLGGALVALLDRRAVFAVNVVIGIPAIVWSLRSMPAPASHGRRLRQPSLANQPSWRGLRPNQAGCAR